jgi:hypothetical protein
MIPKVIYSLVVNIDTYPIIVIKNTRTLVPGIGLHFVARPFQFTIHFQRWKDNEALHFEPALGPRVLFGRPVQLKFSENRNNVDYPKGSIQSGRQH